MQSPLGSADPPAAQSSGNEEAQLDQSMRIGSGEVEGHEGWRSVSNIAGESELVKLV